ncbi:MAG: hypothetical protein ACR2J3_12675 [Aridibacter sp.]|jgi:hypothetical protein
MLKYQIDDLIDEPLTHSIEVTVELNGQERWCFFVTPEILASIGDWIDGTKVRVHLGVPHMIVVSKLNEEIIDRVLKQLYDNGQLENHTTKLV